MRKTGSVALQIEENHKIGERKKKSLDASRERLRCPSESKRYGREEKFVRGASNVIGEEEEEGAMIASCMSASNIYL